MNVLFAVPVIETLAGQVAEQPDSAAVWLRPPVPDRHKCSVAQCPCSQRSGEGLFWSWRT